jgi:enamine deaminase RidA (YjgF/YER057c/UK114 family)
VEQQFDSDDFVAQARQALMNIVALMHEAGGKIEHIARLAWYVTDKKEYLSRLSELGRAATDVSENQVARIGAQPNPGWARRAKHSLDFACRSIQVTPHSANLGWNISW